MTTAPQLPAVSPVRPLAPVGPILGHPTRPNIRLFMADGDGAGGDGSSTGNGAGAGSSGGSSTGNGDGGEQGVDAATAKALRDQADKLMRERNTARDQAKAWAELGLTVDDVRALKEARDKAQGGPTPEQIAADARREAEKAANERIATRARVSSVREQAAALGFHSPADALALLPADELAKVTVDDQDEADGAAVKKLLEQLATARPYLVKTPGYAPPRDAGIGAGGSGARPDPGPGAARVRAAYADASTSR